MEGAWTRRPATAVSRLSGRPLLLSRPSGAAEEVGPEEARDDGELCARAGALRTAKTPVQRIASLAQKE